METRLNWDSSCEWLAQSSVMICGCAHCMLYKRVLRSRVGRTVRKGTKYTGLFDVEDTEERKKRVYLNS